MIYKGFYKYAITDDIKLVQDQISKKIAQITELKTKLENAVIQLNKCKAGGVFYSCQKNTGKTQNTWENYISSWKKTIALYETELTALNKKLDLLQAQAKGGADVGAKMAEYEKAQAEANSAKASSYVKWIILGAGVIAVLVGGYFIYKKIKK